MLNGRFSQLDVELNCFCCEDAYVEGFDYRISQFGDARETEVVCRKHNSFLLTVHGTDLRILNDLSSESGRSVKCARVMEQAVTVLQ